MVVAFSGLIATALFVKYGTFYFTFNTCLWFQSAPLIAFNMSFVLVFFIAADRAFAVLLPIRYCHFTKSLPVEF